MRDIIDEMTTEIDRDLEKSGTTIAAVGMVFGEYDRLRAAALAAYDTWATTSDREVMDDAMRALHRACFKPERP